MSEPRSNVESLIEAARRAHDPTPLDQARVRAALLASLGAGAPTPVKGVASSAPIKGIFSLGTGARILLACVGLGGAATLYQVAREGTAKTTRATSAVSS